MLNAEQRQAVEENGHCVVFAPPGSGKTSVLAQKCARLLGLPIAHQKIVVAVTFTRDAAKELSSRIASMVSAEAIKRLQVGTFHALAFRQLRNAGIEMHVVDPLDQWSYTDTAAKRVGYDEEATGKSANDEISRLKTLAFLHPERLSTDTAFPLYQAYQALLKEDGLIDLHDVITQSVSMMREGKIKPYPAFHLLDDEAQDNDDIQYMWIECHRLAGAAITLVGDDDQCVYGWRRALGHNGMQEFAAACHARTVVLTKNYRSHAEITHKASKLIARNRSRQGKMVHSVRGPGASMRTHPVPSSEDEIGKLVEHLVASPALTPVQSNDRSRYSVIPKSWAVLARSNVAFRPVEIALMSAGIPYAINAKSFWGKPPWTGVISLLCDPHSTVAIRGFLSGIGFSRDQVVKILKAASADEKRVQSLEGARGALNNQAGQYLDQVIDRIANAQSRLAAGQTVLAVTPIRAILREWANEIARPEIERDQSLHMSFIRPDLRILWLDTVNRSCDALQEVLHQSKSGYRRRLEWMLETKLEKDAPKVLLLTLHGAKGLEFDNVWIIGANRGAMPSSGADKLKLTDTEIQAFVEEERRLFYVGMTRARNALHVSYSTKKGASVFVDESELELGDA